MEYWVVSGQRFAVVLFLVAVFIPSMLAWANWFDKKDPTYNGANVGTDPVANAIRATGREAIVLFCATWLFVECLKVCLL